MRIVAAKPPMWREIDLTFHIGNKPVIFCWGGIIYNPNGGTITKELIEHESIHHQRQGDDDVKIAAWWTRYLVDHAFRLQEELPAHRAEYLAFCKRHGDGNARNRYLNHIAQRLCGPLYGSLLTAADARKRILTA